MVAGWIAAVTSRKKAPCGVDSPQGAFFTTLYFNQSSYRSALNRSHIHPRPGRMLYAGIIFLGTLTYHIESQSEPIVNLLRVKAGQTFVSNLQQRADDSCGSSIIMARASCASILAGSISPALISGFDRLKHFDTGRVPKKRCNGSMVQSSVNRLRTSSSWPEASRIIFCLAFPLHPGFSQKIILAIGV